MIERLQDFYTIHIYHRYRNIRRFLYNCKKFAYLLKFYSWSDADFGLEDFLRAWLTDVIFHYSSIDTEDGVKTTKEAKYALELVDLITYERTPTNLPVGKWEFVNEELLQTVRKDLFLYLATHYKDWWD